jgi:hypothetical protein
MSDGEHIIRTTDSTRKTRRYVGEHLCLIPACVDPIKNRCNNVFALLHLVFVLLYYRITL